MNQNNANIIINKNHTLDLKETKTKNWNKTTKSDGNIKEYANFYRNRIGGNIEKDTIKKIITIKPIDIEKKIYKCLVEFEEREDGSKPFNTFIPYDILKHKYPKFLLDYIEGFLEFCPKIKVSE